MPVVPTHCTNRNCPNYYDPPERWCYRHGSYHTRAFGCVQRYRCSCCRTTVSDQTESVNYYSKRPLDIQHVGKALVGRSMHEAAKQMEVTDGVIFNHVFRAGRQSMAAQVHMLDGMPKRDKVAFDGLRSFVTSQDFPCDITTVVDSDSETILTMIQSIFRRGGRVTSAQRRRMIRKLAVWQPKKLSMSRDIAVLIHEMLSYLTLTLEEPAIVDTDEHWLYRKQMNQGLPAQYIRQQVLIHRQTSAKAPRTWRNPLFAVNYVDQMLRHREKEHTRETIAFGRSSVMQMHRVWMWAWEHNAMRPYRERTPELGVHAVQGVITEEQLEEITAEFSERRISLRGKVVPRSIYDVWSAEIPNPPMRWLKAEQKQRKPRIPAYCLRDLEEGILQELPASLPEPVARV